MRIIGAKTLSGIALGTTGPSSSLTDVIHSLVKDLLSSYRPELHYMRGPGPKWRAKHQPWLRFDSEAVPPAPQPELSTIHVRRRDTTNHIR
jgi:hypothetical protein